jgi:hypothetical protein
MKDYMKQVSQSAGYCRPSYGMGWLGEPEEREKGETHIRRTFKFPPNGPQGRSERRVAHDADAVLAGKCTDECCVRGNELRLLA